MSNLSAVELGALLWLLDEREGIKHHRLGGGKPFGFGSVKLKVSGLELRDGEGWKTFYKDVLGQSPALTTLEQVQPCIDAYRDAVIKAYSKDGTFENVPFIKAFQRALSGYGDSLPVHYPRPEPKLPTDDPTDHNKLYKWFGNNETPPRSNGPRGALLALPALDGNTHGLPYNPMR